MAGLDFDLVLQVSFFLFFVWFMGRLFTALKLPAILGQLAAGILLGPKTLDMVPYASNGLCDSAVRHPPRHHGFDSAGRRIWKDPSYDGVGDRMRRLRQQLLGLQPADQQAAYQEAADLVHQAASADALELEGDPAPLATRSHPHPFDGIGKCTEVPWERWVDAKHVSSIWPFIGNAGVTLLIMESGMHINFKKVSQVGRKAFTVAVLGTGLPLLGGLLVVGLLFQDERSFYPWGFAAGCAFAPTSVGISIKLLDESKMLNSIAGQTTLTAAFIDDVFSLVTLVMLQKLSKGSLGPTDVIVPIVSSFLFLALGCFLALKVFVHMHTLLEKIPIRPHASIQLRDEVHLTVMLLSLLLFGWLSSIDMFIGSHLLGAFVAGMCFVNVPRSHIVWQSQMKRIVRWTVRIFFAASVGFAVPIEKMFSFAAFWKGVILAFGPTIGAKIISGLFAHMPYASEADRQLARKASWATRFVQPQQLLVGMAMVARGEFAYLVAETAQNAEYRGGPKVDGEYGKMMSEEVYASVVWALVAATIASPLLFRWAIGVFERATPINRSRAIGGADAEFAGRAFVVRIAAKHHTGVQREIMGCLHALGVDVLEARVNGVRLDPAAGGPAGSPASPAGGGGGGGGCSGKRLAAAEEEPGRAFVAHLLVVSRGKKKDFDDEKLEEMHHALTEVIMDIDSQIIFEPPSEDAFSMGLVEIHLRSDLCSEQRFHADVLDEIRDALAELGLEVLAAPVLSAEGTAEEDMCARLYAREASGSLQVAASRRAQIRVALLEVLAQLKLGGQVQVETSEPPRLSEPFRASSRFWCGTPRCASRLSLPSGNRAADPATAKRHVLMSGFGTEEHARWRPNAVHEEHVKVRVLHGSEFSSELGACGPFSAPPRYDETLCLIRCPPTLTAQREENMRVLLHKHGCEVLRDSRTGANGAPSSTPSSAPSSAPSDALLEPLELQVRRADGATIACSLRHALRTELVQLLSAAEPNRVSVRPVEVCSVEVCSVEEEVAGSEPPGTAPPSPPAASVAPQRVSLEWLRAQEQRSVEGRAGDAQCHFGAMSK